MFYKFLSITLLLASNATINASQDNEYQLATTPYSKELALADMLAAEYPVEEKDLVFKGNPDTGANFVDAIIPYTDPATGETIEIRTVCYGPGRQVGDHDHNEPEIFHVKRGSCKVFTLKTEEELRAEHEEMFQISRGNVKVFDLPTSPEKWATSIKNVGDDIIIPAHTRHALIAGKEGLCMHVARNDNTRSVNFTKTAVQPWEQDQN